MTFFITNLNTYLLRYVAAIVAVIVYYLIQNFDIYLATTYIYFLVIIGFLLIGIPHGALDYLLIKNNIKSNILFMFSYLLIVLLYYISWQFLPLFSFFIFMIYSAFHFGESEWIETNKKIDKPVTYLKVFLFGLSILAFIIFSHAEESNLIISNYYRLSIFNDKIIVWFIIIISFMYILIQSFSIKHISMYGLILLLLLGTQVQLIFAFSLYFILQHSFNAWKHLKCRLKFSSKQLYKKSSFYTIGAIVILLLFILNTSEMDNNKSIMSHFFCFLACISLPHVILMHFFYKS